VKMKAITEDWTADEEEELRYLIGLKAINGGGGGLGCFQKNRGVPL